MHPVQAVGLTLRFAAEVTALAAFAWWGYAAAPEPRWAYAIGTPVVAALLWGLFVAPKARTPLPRSGRMMLELALFAAATFALLTVAPLWVPIAYALVALVQWSLLRGSPAGSGRSIE